jgi:Domain of unknown function (DUF4349)
MDDFGTPRAGEPSAIEPGAGDAPASQAPAIDSATELWPSVGRAEAGLVARARVAAGRVLRRRGAAPLLAVAVVAVVIGSAYIAGSPPDTQAVGPAARYQASVDTQSKMASSGEAMPAGTAAPAAAPQLAAGGDGTGSYTSGGYQPAAPSGTIIKTGELSLEVAGIDDALASAQSTVAAAGGYVASSNRSGTGEGATASITFRIPAEKWDNTLATLRKIGSRIIFEQTGATDVSAQVVDLNARIDNLQKTEAALQSIMARASAVPDVLAVETQLSDVQGQIEQLQGQRDHLNDQAAMSTLTVDFSLPATTVTTQAAQDWSLGNQVDNAVAALVRIGQGLATLAVWAVIVVLPVGVALLVLAGLWLALRRISRRRSDVAAA